MSRGSDIWLVMPPYSARHHGRAIDPNLEAAAITRLVCKPGDKAPLFNNVIGPKDGLWRILGAPASIRKSPSERCGPSNPLKTSRPAHVGAIAGEPIKLVKCDTNDLMVPANAEIVLEGTMSTTERQPKGPFGETHGYTYPGESHPGPRYTVNSCSRV
ncbi:3-octaprenyl-4-hydroxybenzoate carboxy-lyase domain-containing protein [Trichoderma compactum]